MTRSRPAAIRFFGLALLVLSLSAPVARAAIQAPEVPDSAFAQSVVDDAGPRVAARLITETDGVATDQPFRVGILFDIQPGWHIYWRNPGDSALPTRIAWQVEEATVGRGVDVAIEVSGSPAAMESGLAHLRVGGRYIWAGAVCPDRPVEISAETVVRRLTTIRGVHNYTPDDLKTAVRFLQDNAGRYPFDSLVSRSFALSQVQSAFEHAIDERPLRVAVVPDGAGSTT